jgi:peptidoglycan hydrolase CwlO-like protein
MYKETFIITCILFAILSAIIIMQHYQKNELKEQLNKKDKKLNDLTSTLEV